MNRDQLLTTAGETLAFAEDYLETKVELLKLDAAGKGARIGAEAITAVIVGLLFVTAMWLFSLALAIWLGFLVGSFALGFCIVGVIYLIVGGIFYSMRKHLLTEPLLQLLIAKLFQNQTKP